MAFINTVDVLGDETLLDMLIERSVTEYRDDSITSIGAYALYKCTVLTVVDTPAITLISSTAMQYCSVLTKLILRNTAVVATLNGSAFKNTPIANGTGYIYVPAALVDSYKAATNWSTYADQFRALEDYTVDGTVTGDLDETKI